MKAVLLCGLAALGQLADAKHELAIGGVTLGQSEDSVVRSLGKPTSRRTAQATDYLPITLAYPGFTVELDEQGVGRVLSSNGRFCTPAGVCPGMRFAEAQRIYGPAMAVEQVDAAPKGYVFGDGCWLAFVVRSDEIETIEVACTP